MDAATIHVHDHRIAGFSAVLWPCFGRDSAASVIDPRE
jgi:hypothetical protein